MLPRLHRLLLTPKASEEDIRRREFILNILLLGTILLAFVLTTIASIDRLLLGSAYTGSPIIVPFAALAIFISLLVASRRGHSQIVAYVYVGIFLLLATYPSVVWGILLPQGILTYALVIVITGVLLSGSMAFWITALMFVMLTTIVGLQNAHVIVVDTEWTKVPGGYSDVVAYSITFGVIALVSWLSNRETRQSLEKVRASERALLLERRSLEIKVRERTKALEKAQVEKMLDLQRFAEFGRQSATLLHELANPLTAVSLNLEELEGKNRSKFVSRAREGIDHIEQYVAAARRQLRNQSEITRFDVGEEIRRVSGFLGPKAMTQGVQITLELARGVQLTGDSIRFNHIISNLLSNAIDAYDGVKREHKEVRITMEPEGQMVVIGVRDYGSGITDAQLKHLFEPFYTTKKEGQGTGIGLAITKQAVEEAFKGTIGASYDKRSGTNFTVKLPLM